MNFDGILLIDKEKGWTSFDVVAKVRSLLSKEYFEATGEKKKIKVGHTGTLDPLATGLMVVVVGSYCKRAGEFSKLDKVYEAQMKLGETSTTGDEEGGKSRVSEKVPTKNELKEVLHGFLGESMQTPPSFSAIKVGGERAYKLAREGREVKIEPRKVNILSIELISYEYPFANFIVRVSSGTYIRSLVKDIGKALDTGAYMSELRRTKVGMYSIENSVLADNVVSNDIIK